MTLRQALDYGRRNEALRLAEGITGSEASSWPGNCHGVACHLAEAVGGTVARGFWHGSVAQGSIFEPGSTGHSWIVLPDGRIVDPTRWAFDRPDDPYIYVGTPGAEYDTFRYERGREQARRSGNRDY